MLNFFIGVLVGGFIVDFLWAWCQLRRYYNWDK